MKVNSIESCLRQFVREKDIYTLIQVHVCNRRELVSVQLTMAGKGLMSFFSGLKQKDKNEAEPCQQHEVCRLYPQARGVGVMVVTRNVDGVMTDDHGLCMLLGYERAGQYKDQFNLCAGGLDSKDKKCIVQGAMRELREEFKISLNSEEDFHKYFGILRENESEEGRGTEESQIKFECPGVLWETGKWREEREKSLAAQQNSTSPQAAKRGKRGRENVVEAPALRYFVHQYTPIFLGMFPTLSVRDINESIRKANATPSLDWSEREMTMVLPFNIKQQVHPQYAINEAIVHSAFANQVFKRLDEASLQSEWERMTAHAS